MGELLWCVFIADTKIFDPNEKKTIISSASNPPIPRIMLYNIPTRVQAILVIQTFKIEGPLSLSN